MAQQPEPELAQMLFEIDTNRIQIIIETLVSFGTRHTASNQTDPNRGIGAARTWLQGQFESIAATSNGRMNVTVQSFVQQPATGIAVPTVISNVFATLQGTEGSNRVYVVSGHYDSRNTDINDFTNDAPGADDDGSGVAVSLELARIMATRQPLATIIFAAGELTLFRSLVLTSLQ